MSSVHPDPTTNTEYCSECDEQTNHATDIELVTESDRYGGNQPYRVTECRTCGHTERERVGVGGSHSGE